MYSLALLALALISAASAAVIPLEVLSARSPSMVLHPIDIFHPPTLASVSLGVEKRSIPQKFDIHSGRIPIVSLGVGKRDDIEERGIIQEPFDWKNPSMVISDAVRFKRSILSHPNNRPPFTVWRGVKRTPGIDPLNKPPQRIDLANMSAAERFQMNQILMRDAEVSKLVARVIEEQELDFLEARLVGTN